MAQQQGIHKFVLGNKEFEGKTSEFMYDHGWYSIADIVGEERSEIYKSRNAQEAYLKWNVYIGRKKERSLRENHRTENESGEIRRNVSEHRKNSRGENKWERGAEEQQEHNRKSRSNSGEKAGSERRTEQGTFHTDGSGTKKKNYSNKHRKERRPKDTYNAGKIK